MEFKEDNFNSRYDITNVLHNEQVARKIGNAIANDPKAKNNSAIIFAHQTYPNDADKRREFYSQYNYPGSPNSDISTSMNNNNNDDQNDDSHLIFKNSLNDEFSSIAQMPTPIDIQQHPQPATQKMHIVEMTDIEYQRYQEYLKTLQNQP